MSRFSEELAAHFGTRCSWGFMMLFSMRLDETATHGEGDFMTVAGAVAEVPNWDNLEDSWRAKLAPRGIEFFHLKDFDGRQGVYYGWSDRKCQLFENGLRGIIRHNTLFRCSVAIHSAAHKHVKKRMVGVTGYRPESDYALCLRYLLLHSCKVLEKRDPDFALDVMVERGPWSSGALATFEGMTKRSRIGSRLGTFSAPPKGKFASLDAADLIAGREHVRLMKREPPDPKDEVLAHVLTEEDMERFYEMMIEEKEVRRAFGFNPKSKKKGEA